ncbi:uncharacterized protein LOC131257758 isoform X2 [Magnolia sinica]|uniref:uncharacterized protein LOC131257758 isoform X2 n=1 Tax=Magnolia sinica TaxID=86752 RepID=UPI002657AB48|nr:uncharacterized protein LOC131257758 isoform X2 [Magnolia sinica]
MMMMDGRETLMCVEDDDEFFESFNRISCAVPVSVGSYRSDEDDDDDEYDDSRMSFASAVGPPMDCRFSTASMADAMPVMHDEEYNFWMAEPMSIQERRVRLLQGMGLGGSKELLRVASSEFCRVNSSRAPMETRTATEADVATAKPEGTTVAASTTNDEDSLHSVLARSRSAGAVVVPTSDIKHQAALVRTNSAPSSLCTYRRSDSLGSSEGQSGTSMVGGATDEALLADSALSFFKIKDLDTGKEFIVKEFREDGTWNRLSDAETGEQLTMEEFERCVGYSPIVKELMRRVNSQKGAGDGNSSLSNNFSKSTKKKGWLKNIKGVANSVSGLIGEWERDSLLLGRSGRHSSSSSQNDWMKVRHRGKSYKEFTGLHMCQEIQAHQGSIWTIRFSLDARYLASAGEDRVIHVWQVLDCENILSVASEEGGSNASPVLSPSLSNASPDRPPIPRADAQTSEKKRKGKISSGSRKGSSARQNIFVPETVFSLSDKPLCSFQGHQDDVLDLSWSKSQQLLSSSMDKTVRLWDMETKSCLKLFAHNDYVTCIQFNPIDDQYFISGSLDAKVRIWSIPDRQSALVGSHKGSCRLYDTSDCKLVQIAQMEIQTKKKKANPKKITGFQFSPGNPSEVLVTSADSQIRIFNGVNLIHKFRGFRNTSSQISASFTTDGKYVVCASEDSQVYVWKREELRNVGGSGKRKGFITTRSHEHFHCKDVSVAIPWPGVNKYEPPSLSLPLGSRRQNHNHPPKHTNTQPASSGDPTLEEPVMGSSKNHFPPLPKKSLSEWASPCPDEELANPSRSDSGIGGLSSASGSPSKSRGLSSISSSAFSPSSPWRWYDANSTGSSGVQTATAWGLVIVTAGLGGEIRTYQNFGLPIRLSRQANLF